MDCIFCGSWFGSSNKDDKVCSSCERAMRQLRLDMSPVRLEELSKADKGGRLVVLQCKVGDKIWYIFDGKPYQSTVHGISVSPSGELAIHFGGWPADVVWASNIGKTVFLTRQEAEEALNHAKGD